MASGQMSRTSNSSGTPRRHAARIPVRPTGGGGDVATTQSYSRRSKSTRRHDDRRNEVYAMGRPMKRRWDVKIKPRFTMTPSISSVWNRRPR